ncbi:hypothetical protein HDU85_003113 [Gaertneriomyces sp. JEL0708]|nr:hypothetical protein HDU85_003113 [Gaertneriomyces sp. JEL0708]
MADAKLPPDHPDRLVATYLRSRGFKQAENAFKAEAKLLSLDDVDQALIQRGEASVPDYILYYNENEANQPDAYKQSYSRLRKWIDDSIDKYKFELRRVLYPIFVHSYLDLITRGLRDEAKKFLNAFKSDHLELHGQDVHRLTSVTSVQHITENELARNFRTNKYGVQMSRFSFELLFSFLQDNKYMFLLRVLNEHVAISVTTTEPVAEALKDEETGLLSNTVQELENFNMQKVNLTQLPPDSAFLDDVERYVQEQSWPDASAITDELNKIKKEPSTDAAALATPPSKLQDIPATVRILRDAANRATLGPTSLPSICCYTFHNTYGRLQSLSLSPDSQVIAGAFADSHVRVWNIAGGDVKASPPHGPNSEQTSVKGKKPRSSARLLGHSGPVYASSFSSDQRYLMTCSEDKTARLWSLDTLTNIAVYKGHSYPVWDVAFAQQGWYFATASHDRSARLWSCDHIYPLRIFVGHLSDVDTVRFHPNGNYVLTGSSDRTCRLWDVQTGTCVRLFKGHRGAVQTVAFSPDGLSMASAGDDNTVILWDIGSGKPMKIMPGHTAPVYSLAFSQDGHVLASGGADQCVRIWDAAKSDHAVVKREANADRPSWLGAYPTKRTPIYNLQFTRTNVLMAMGTFEL